MKIIGQWLLAAALVALGTLTSAAADTAKLDKQQVEEIVHDYLLTHPEILREMSEKLQIKEKQEAENARLKTLGANAKLVFKFEGDAVVGNPQGDVTLVEFMDYNCGWCRKSVNEVVDMTSRDTNLRVVFKEFPIFGQGSEYAAKAALAANRQGKYWELHRALFAHEGQVTPEVVDQVAKGLGVDVDLMKRDMDDSKIRDTIAANYDLAKSLQIEGTPAFVIDQTVIPGYSPARVIEEQIAGVRANGGCKLC